MARCASASADGACVIDTTSVAAYKGVPVLMDYASMKGAIGSFTRSLALNLAANRIRMDRVAPAPIWTPLIPASFDEKQAETFGRGTSIGRSGQPDEVAPCYVFLARPHVPGGAASGFTRIRPSSSSRRGRFSRSSRANGWRSATRTDPRTMCRATASSSSAAERHGAHAGVAKPVRVFASLVLCTLLGIAAAAPTGGRAEVAYTEVDKALPKPPGEGADIERAVAASIAGTNAFRQRHGLPALHREPHLMEAARGFAGFLSETHRIGHTADGRTPGERAEAAGYRYCSVRENLAYRYSSRDFAADELASAFVEGWKSSPEHRQNLLSEHSVDTAVAVARSAETGAYFAVQMFGRPASARIRFEVVNETGKTVRYTVGEGGQSGQRQELEIPPNAVHEHERCGPVTVAVPAAEGETPVEVQDEAVLRLTAGRDGPVAVDIMERTGGRDGR